jgi:NDP-sugar pyrophosphorylase family protein
MMPLSLRYPKALLPFCGRPLIEYTLEALFRQGFQHAILVAGLCDDGLQQYEAWGDQGGFRVSVVMRSLEFGSAGVVRDLALQGVAGEGDILVIYGDSLISLDLRGLLALHQAGRARGRDLTVAYHTPTDLIAPGRARTDYGLLWLDSDQRVVRYAEKPLAGQVSSSHANAGVLVISQSIFERFPEGRTLDFSKDVLEDLANHEDSTVYGFDIGSGYRYDIGTIDRYTERQFAVLRRETILEGVPWSRVWDTGPLPFGGRVEGRAMIAQDSSLHEGVTLVGTNVIGRRASIGARSVITDSVILDDTTIGDSVKLSGAVIGDSCRVGDGAAFGPGTVLGAFSAVSSAVDH